MKKFILKETQIKVLVENELHQKYIDLLKNVNINNIEFINKAMGEDRYQVQVVINNYEIPSSLVYLEAQEWELTSGESTWIVDIKIDESLRGTGLAYKVCVKFIQIYGTLMFHKEAIHNPKAIGLIQDKLSNTNGISSQDTEDGIVFYSL